MHFKDRELLNKLYGRSKNTILESRLTLPLVWENWMSSMQNSGKELKDQV